MSIQNLAYLASIPAGTVNDGQFRVLFTIITEGGPIIPGNPALYTLRLADLAKRLGRTTRAVSRHLAELEAKGIIERIHQYGEAGEQLPTYFKVLS